MSDHRIDRRKALGRITLAGTSAALAAGLAATGTTSGRGGRAALADHAVTILLDEPIGTIRPAIYSQFAEHIGGVIYDGIWVGPDSKIAEHRRHPPRRWSSTCDSSGQSSCAGRGAASPTSTTGATASARADRRPRRFGRWREETETNQFGTHEFIRFCRLCGVEPYFAGQRRDRLARGVPAVGRVLQRTGRLDLARR